VGADQILWLKKPHQSGLDVRMEIFNADGTTAEMCGNGIRAVAIYLRDHGFTRLGRLQIETLAGVKSVQFVSNQEDQVEVDMGAPRLGSSLTQDGEEIRVESGGEVKWHRFYEVSMGNPHAVIFVEDLQAVPVQEWGAPLEVHPRFPGRTNVEFVEVVDDHTIRVGVWERGAGITLACGTGACASAVASLATGRVKNPVEVQLPGGSLRISWTGMEPRVGVVKMTGTAATVFKGEYFLGEIATS
jgi:diaminopimelate epimerase